MKALITGASSGLGREMARLLAARGYELILCARREERLRELAAELPVPCRIIAADVSDEQECRLLYEAVQSEKLEVVINNAGFGLFGEFVTADLDEELRMIDTNVRAVHILTKLAVRDFVQRRRGYILNVSSSAGFLPGPLMATYYATKNYEAVDGLFAGKAVVVPGAAMKAMTLARHFAPDSILARITYHFQHKKGAK